MRNFITVAAFVALASVVLYFPVASIQNTGGDKSTKSDSGKKASKSKKDGNDGGPYPGSSQQPTIDLSGKWKTEDGKEVVIEQNGPAVKATFVIQAGRMREGICPVMSTPGWDYFQGTLSGNSLTGTMKRCTRNRQLLLDCNLKDPYDANIKDATVDQNTIAGKYVPDYITYVEKNGHYTNCGIKPGAGDPGNFELTRECGANDARRQHPHRSSGNCKPDRVKGCKDLEETKIAFVTLGQQAIKNDDFSNKAMERLKAAIDPLLDTLRADFCDNSSALETLDKLSDELSNLLCDGDWVNRERSLNFFEHRLNLMRRDVCGWSPAP